MEPPSRFELETYGLRIALLAYALRRSSNYLPIKHGFVSLSTPSGMPLLPACGHSHGHTGPGVSKPIRATL
jgi:hypothetical protein